MKALSFFLEAIFEMKNDFISNVSHELRTPLTSIKGSIINLLDGILGNLNAAQKEYLSIINSESNRLVRLIDDLLDLNNVATRQIKIVPKEIEYISLVAQVVFSLKELAYEKGLFMEMQWPKTEIYLKADSDRVNQILVNLINNAIKFTEQGGVKVIVDNSSNISLRGSKTRAWAFPKMNWTRCLTNSTRSIHHMARRVRELV